MSACAKSGCRNPGNKVCSRCKGARYCSAKHQEQCWNQHKDHCVPKTEASSSPPSSSDTTSSSHSRSSSSHATSTSTSTSSSSISAEKDMLVLDGSTMEGGGQVIRQSMALAQLLGRSITVNNIRARRSNPGLARQHLTGIELVASTSEGVLTGGALKSNSISFVPGPGSKKSHFVSDIQTAGAITLLLQVALPGLLFFPHSATLELKGGTNASNAPQIDYATDLFSVVVKKHFHLDFDIQIKQRGFFPRGGGLVAVTTRPTTGPLPAISLMNRGNIVRVSGVAIVYGRLPGHIATRMIEATTKILHEEFKDLPIAIRQDINPNAPSPGCSILLIAETDTGMLLGGSAIGEKGVPAETVAEQAAGELLKQIKQGGCVDEYLQDQLIIFMAIAEGVSRIRTGPLTLHTETAIHFAKVLTDGHVEFRVVPDEATFIIECKGIGLRNAHLSPSNTAAAR